MQRDCWRAGPRGLSRGKRWHPDSIQGGCTAVFSVARPGIDQTLAAWPGNLC